MPGSPVLTNQQAENASLHEMVPQTDNIVTVADKVDMNVDDELSQVVRSP